MVTTQLATGADYLFANVHPWFGGLPVDQAAGWIYEYTNTNEPSTALLAPNKPTLYVAEAGWPTGANQTSLMTYQGATRGDRRAQHVFADVRVSVQRQLYPECAAAEFIFEAFDEPWKDVLYGGVEAHWGCLMRIRVEGGVGHSGLRGSLDGEALYMLYLPASFCSRFCNHVIGLLYDDHARTISFDAVFLALWCGMP